MSPSYFEGSGLLLCDETTSLDKYIQRLQLLSGLNFLFSVVYLYQAVVHTGALLALALVLMFLYFFDFVYLFTITKNPAKIFVFSMRVLRGAVIAYTCTWLVNLLYVVVYAVGEDSKLSILLPIITLTVKASSACLVRQLPRRVNNNLPVPDYSVMDPRPLNDPLV